MIPEPEADLDFERWWRGETMAGRGDVTPKDAARRAWATAESQLAAARTEVERLRADLARRPPAPPDERYYCGCPVTGSDAIKAFCREHHQPINWSAKEPTT